MIITFKFEDLEIHGYDESYNSINVEVDLRMVEEGIPAISQSMNYNAEPACPAEWEINEIRIEKMVISESYFLDFFHGSQDIINNAYEYAAECEDQY